MVSIVMGSYNFACTRHVPHPPSLHMYFVPVEILESRRNVFNDKKPAYSLPTDKNRINKICTIPRRPSRKLDILKKARKLNSVYNAIEVFKYWILHFYALHIYHRHLCSISNIKIYMSPLLNIHREGVTIIDERSLHVTYYNFISLTYLSMYSNNTEILRTRFTIVWYSINCECYTGLDVTITPELEGMPTGLTGANEDSILQLPFLWQMSEPKWKKKV